MTQIETTKRNRFILKLAKEGYTADEITEIVKIKRSRVLQILRAYKVKAARPSHELQCEKALAVIEELNKGTKQSDIARKLGVSRQYVSQIKYKLISK